MALSEVTVKDLDGGGNILGVRIETQRPEPADLPEIREIVFRLQDVSVAYDSNVAVRDVTLDVPAKQITAIIGPSGCGKSTLI
ncbi:MAG: ATP-binding cassette domain-containing protein, partial [Actinomycetota bacterium]